MRQALSFFVLLLVVAAVEASADITRTVIVMRHCVRTTPFTLDGEILSNFNDYSSRPFPQWKYPAWQCVPRGLDLIAMQGAYLREKQPLAQPLIKVVSDAIDRDIDTSHFLLQGLGEPSFPVVADGAIFDAQQGGVCPPDPVEWNDEMILLRLSQAPIPHHHRQLLNSLQAKLGRGIAPSFTNISDSANVSTFVGGSAVAAEIAGYFEMAVGAGIDMSWANVTADDVRNMLPLIVYQHNVWMRALPLAQHGHSNLLAHVLRDLDPVSPSGTSFYVGHDSWNSDIDGLAEMLGIAWSSHPLPDNHTAPGCMLRFDVRGVGHASSVTVSFTYADVTSPDPVVVYTGATFFTDTHQASKPLDSFLDSARAQLYMPCVNLSSHA